MEDSKSEMSSISELPAERPSRFRRIRGWLLTVGILSLVAVGVVAMTNRGATAPPHPTAKQAAPNAVTVTTEHAVIRPVQRKVDVVGSLWGRDEIAVTSKVEGKILKIHHDVGDIVRPGDVLLEIDPTDYRLAAQETLRALDLELSRLNLRLPEPVPMPREGSQLEREMARLGMRNVPPSDFDATRLPSVQKAAAHQRQAIAKRDRVVKLAAAPTEEKEQAETEVAVSQAAYFQALIDAEAIVASVKLKKAALEIAMQRLLDTRVIVPDSPAAGKIRSLTSVEPNIEYVIGKRSVSAGEKVSTAANAPIFKLVVTDPLKLLVTVPERHLRDVKVDQIVEMFVESHANEPFRGLVSRIHPTVDRDNRTFEVEVQIPNSDRQWHAGSFVNGSILIRDEPAITVPEEALVTTGSASSIFVLRNSHAVEVPVAIGVRIEAPGPRHNRWWVEVRGNLKAGEDIITSGQTQLADGTPVKVRPNSMH